MKARNNISEKLNVNCIIKATTTVMMDIFVHTGHQSTPIYKMSNSQFGNKFTKKCAKSQQGLTTSEQSWQAKQGSISQSMLSGDSSKYMKSMRKVAANKDNFTLKKIFNKKMWQPPGSPINFQETGCWGK